ncbi:tripartite motif-containing protein 44 isoform X2 [Sander vitreus]
MLTATMDHKGEPHEGAMGLKHEELPQMDGLCDACEPDEAQPATQVCHTCSFAFCSVHADRHASSTHHPIMPYNHEGTQANGLGNNRCSRVGDGAEDVAGSERAARLGVNQEMAPLGVAMANGDESGDAGEREGAKNGVQLEAELGDGAEGAEAGQEVVAAREAGKRDTVTVERLRCKEHGQEGSLYCKPDEKIICVVCAVQGEHREHEIITLHEAYVWQKSRQGYDLLGCTQQMGEKIKTKWTNPEMSTEELEAYVNSQFDELRKLVRLEEKRTLHLVDLKEAFLTASAAEKIAEISVETERLQEEMDNITHQLCLLERAEGLGPAVAAQALAAAPAHRVQRDIEARPRLPEPRAEPMDQRDFDDNNSGPSMDHAP